MQKPLRTSDLVFSASATDFSETLKSIKRSTLCISNRLRSIEQDSQFVCTVADAYNLPLVANERCGSWYIPPERKAGSAYFKSTDGHMGEWSFSLRRLNTQVLDVIGQHDGCVIVDSTRRGKRMPDALSKTIPIWCAVLNRALFPKQTNAHQLHSPPISVSISEHSQIEARLGLFLKQLQELGLPLSAFREKLSKPLRPLWVTQESILPTGPSAFDAFHPVVLCTSSRRVPGGEVSEGGYIQGAGDDSEGWARGLTSQSFWQNKERLMRTSENDLPDLIQELVGVSGLNVAGGKPVLIQPTTVLHLSAIDVAATACKEFDAVVSCGASEDTGLRELLKSNYLHLQCTAGKLGSRDLRGELHKFNNFFVSRLPVESILICCPTGKDLSVGVALAALCMCCDDNVYLGNLKTQSSMESITKALIRQRLSWIMTSHPSANPSRATLQSVNAFLMQRLSPPAAIQQPPPGANGHLQDHNRPVSTEASSALSPPDGSNILQAARPSSITGTFNALSGSWTVNRTLTSYHPGLPSGTFIGNATFTARTPTSRGNNVDAEYLYSETGVFKTSTGLEMHAGRKYIYRLQTGTEEISVWFVGDDGESAAGLGWRLGSDQLDGNGKIVTKGGHLCGEDQYDARYEFQRRIDQQEPSVDSFRLIYQVKGPRKKYSSETWFTR
ncbi:tRNA A64-2'-O-ribosylphosphate transferase [Coniosporium tulheliwenetii]|uniref:tRNA A64-2'-O-ribosylphosphate transferase n=1 Tax=Coniosporium tulheliwenetii TaxID=3383036 RepID=A0ACC2Z5P4_9PEZI|nr:tRNA A64-2'-O-ribosylphosphate transferase [Cladosporium sp. JES 115]